MQLYHNFNHMAKGRKTGGRKKGTANKSTIPEVRNLQTRLAQLDLAYVTPQAPTPDNPQGLSQYELDLIELSPNERVTARFKSMKFHTPERKAVDIDATLDVSLDRTLEDTLSTLADI